MQLSTLLVLPIVLAVNVLAGHNCKCQDSRGQNNEATYNCCLSMFGGKYHGDDEYHQCSATQGNDLDNGAFAACCHDTVGMGTYCWK